MLIVKFLRTAQMNTIIDRYNTLKQEMAVLLANLPTEEDKLSQWLKKRSELAQQLFALGEILEKNGHFSEAAGAYWLSYKANGLLAAKKRLYPAVSSRKVPIYLDEKLPVMESKATIDNHFHRGICYLSGIGVKSDYERAGQYFMGAARHGNVEAQINLGLMYEEGEGVQQDYSKAFEWYSKAAEQRHPLAQYNLGQLYDLGQGVQQDYAEAAKWYYKAAEQGYAEAQINLGFLFSSGGKGVQQDYSKAFEWYSKAAEQGNPLAQYSLGQLYKSGQGIQQDYAEAVRWYCKAAEQGNPIAQYDLGQIYNFGRGVQQNYAEAVKWYRKAAEQGHVKAQTNLVTKYYRGDGVQQNYAEAFKWCCKAAKQGNPIAQYSLGQLYTLGRGVQQDYAEAFKWYCKAAKQGHSLAQSMLGQFYSLGRGVQQDYIKAVKWYRKAAEQNHAHAAYKLSAFYLSGQGGVPKDESEHDKLYDQAITYGSIEAKKELNARYETNSHKFSTSSKASTRYRFHYSHRIKNARIMLKRCAATGDFISRYNYALACSNMWQISTLMAESPTEFFQAMQADKFLTQEEYRAKIIMLIDKYANKIDSKQLAPELYKLASENFYCEEPNIKTAIAYLNRITKDSQCYLDAQKLLMEIYSVKSNHNRFLIAQANAVSAAQEESEVANVSQWIKEEDHKNLFSNIATKIADIEIADLKPEQVVIISALKDTAQSISSGQENSWAEKLSILLHYIDVAKKMAFVKEEGILYNMTEFFKKKPKTKDLCLLLDEILNVDTPEINEANNNNNVNQNKM